MILKPIAGVAVVAALAAGGAVAVANGAAGPAAKPQTAVTNPPPRPGASRTAPGTAARRPADTRAAGRAARRAWAKRYGQDRATMPVQPDVGAASAEQRAAALDLLQRTESATAAYNDLATAKAAGYDLQASLERLARTRPAAYRRLMSAKSAPDGSMPMLHVFNKAFVLDGSVLEPTQPELLMYEPDASGGWKLIGAVFTARAAFPKAPPTPGGPITRWHYHSIGGQPSGTLMMHVFFDPSDDLARSYATRMEP